MRIGELTSRIDVLAFVQTGTDSRGKKVGNWRVVYPNVPAAISPLAGKEIEYTRQVVPTATHKITMRPLEITSENKLRCQGTIFDIGWTNTGKWLECLVTETRLLHPAHRKTPTLRRLHITKV